MAEAELTAKIKHIVDKTFEDKSDESLAAASSVAKEMARRFLDKTEKKVDRALECSSSTNLKSKGNQNQFEFCQKLTNTLDNVESALVDKDIDAAKEHLAEGKKLIKKRVKLIKLADREDWMVVSEYMSDDLASNSEDEKHINRARRSAAAKKEKFRKYRSRKSYSRYQNYNRYQSVPQDNLVNNMPRQRTNVLRCWTCGKLGHVQANCYSRQQALTVPNVAPMGNQK